MWYFTKKSGTDVRPTLQMAETESAANEMKQAALELDPTTVLGDVFEESHDYQFSFPRINGAVTLSDGSEELTWTDGVRTPRV